MFSRIRLFDVAWLLAFGIASSIWCVTVSRQIGATYDEPTYLEHGLHFWRTGSHRQLMRLGTMPLPVDLQTLPLAVAEHLRGEPWNWDTDCERILPYMRHANLIFWWLLLAAAMMFGRDLGGSWGGRIAVALLSCEPNLLAHASLATTDIAVTACLVAFAVAYRRGRDGDRKSRIVWPGLWFGLALLSKASALLFGPLIMLAIDLTQARYQRPRPWGEHIKICFSDWVRIGLIGLAIAFIGCGCDFQPQESFVAWAKSLPDGTPRTIWVWIAKHLKIFGNAGEAIVAQIKHNMRGHGQFLLGDEGNRPFWYYFPTLFLIKLTLPILVLVVLVAMRSPKSYISNAALCLAVIFFLFSINCRVQIGIRLQLPAIAFLLIGLASLYKSFTCNVRPCYAVSMVVTGIAWMSISSILIWPHGLSYVNELWGGSDRGYWLVGDSNYDWGQGLPELKKWHDRSGKVGLDVWYFGHDPMLKRLPIRDLPLHCVPLHSEKDMRTYCWGRYLAVGTSVRHGYTLSHAHRISNDFLKKRAPIARTQTFLIYDLTDLPPPDTVAQAFEARNP